ncbi:MAG TPA: type II secretion system protein [Tepidisphaeraceae bacterium]|nr:type II secretion system protein [Tepidisphaeraceae bacterium]
MFCSRTSVRRDRRGLTLVEISIVVGVIALLASLLIPVVGRARANARLVQCISNLRQFDVAFKGRDVNKPDTRLPPAAMWMSVVSSSAQGGHKLLQCPDGSATTGGEAGGMSALFHVWQGNGAGNPNGSRNTGNTTWRETRSATAADGSYTLSYQTKPNGPRLVVAYRPIGGDLWSAAVTRHPGAGCRIDAIITSDGRRFTNVKQGFTVEYTAMDGGLDYAFNSMAGGLADTKSGKVVVMDFHNKSVFDFNGWQTPSEPDDYLPAAPLAKRHLKKINALLSDGAVKSFEIDELAPSSTLYAIASSRGPNPGSPAPTSATNVGGK